MANLQLRSIQHGLILAQETQLLREVHCLQPVLMRVRQGQKHWWLGEHSGVASTGQLLLMPAGATLTVRNEPGPQGYRCEVITLSPQLVQLARQQHAQWLAPQATHSPRYSCPASPVIGQQWDELFAALAAHEPEPLLEHRACGLLLSLLLADCGGHLLLDRSSRSDERVQQLLLLNPGHDWTVQALARQLHVGESTLRRQLQQEGTSFRQLLDQVRLNTALGLLQTTRQPIGQIALQCGYASASRFSQRFSQRFGIGPQQLRKSIPAANH
ncbi:helix-turn-helix transcriptional regulator [Chitinibacter tainanensis]|uniref:helix-turn-helix transcriptional regulator n=1 Tax=Chitinibacter tainanensis TaxID=230667 RepID=UPI00040A4D1A|nr:helix-turn-helix transcriptional regulator [Chitinibacter tainanensis]